jgi:4-methylaminobutanoate oxidase (formaldehyde-forming)
MVYTAMLNERGGFESDLTLTRIADDSFFILTGSAQATRDADWIVKHIGDGEFAALVDVTSAYSVLSVMGPKAAELLGRLSPDDLSRQGVPFSETREIDVGYARVRAARISYIGGPGYELYVATDQCVTLYDALHEAGRAVGLRDAGYYTIDALRIEAGRRAWGAELGPDETPLEAGLAYAVRIDKASNFIGRDALLRQQAEGLKKRLLLFTFDDPAAFPWGGEPISTNGQSVGELTSAGYSRKQGRAVAMGYARSDRVLSDAELLAARYQVDIAGEAFDVTPHLKPA